MLTRSLHIMAILFALANIGRAATESVPFGGVSVDPPIKSTLALRGRKAGRCPDGGTIRTYKDSLSAFDPNLWQQLSNAQAMTYGKDGLTMGVDESMQGAGSVLIGSTARWRPPFKMSFKMQTSNAIGIPHAFVMKNEGDRGEEIDLEVFSKTLMMPPWRPATARDQRAGRLKIGKDITEKVFTKYGFRKVKDGNSRIKPFEYTKNDFKPYDAFHVYKLDWKRDSITWYLNKKPIVQYKRMKGGDWPMGPLQIRAGPWIPEAGATWAGGHIAWAKTPHPRMKIKDFRVTGCQV